jgi:hypothetical protein
LTPLVKRYRREAHIKEVVKDALQYLAIGLTLCGSVLGALGLREWIVVTTTVASALTSGISYFKLETVLKGKQQACTVSGPLRPLAGRGHYCLPLHKALALKLAHLCFSTRGKALSMWLTTVRCVERHPQDIERIKQKLAGMGGTPSTSAINDKVDEPKRVRELVAATEHAFEAESSAWVVSLRNNEDSDSITTEKPRPRQHEQ